MTSSEFEDPGKAPTELLAAVRSSYQLLGQLLHSHRNYLLKLIGEELDPRLNRRQGASDIVQTAMLHVLENFGRATEGIFAVGTEEDLRKWLRQICLHTLYQVNRDEGRELRDFRHEEPNASGIEPHGGDPSPSHICRDREQHDALVSAVNTLPEADRILLRLREFHDWTYMALAELLDGEATEPGRVRMQRRLTELRFTLGEDANIKGLD